MSVAEAIDAAQAVAMVGVDRRALREALAATLVKDERDRGVFLAAFDATFPARVRDVTSDRRRPRARGARRRRARVVAAERAMAARRAPDRVRRQGRARRGRRACRRTSRRRAGSVRAPNRPPRATDGTVGRDPSAREPTGKGANDARTRVAATRVTPRTGAMVPTRSASRTGGAATTPAAPRTRAARSRATLASAPSCGCRSAP